MDVLPRFDTVLELVATCTIIVAAIYAAFALYGSARGLRLSGIFFVVALSLYANNWGTYFAAIFIVATAVTELEFLEKLAAIIRGSKEYFDYKKSQIPVQEAKAKADAEGDAVMTSAPAGLDPAGAAREVAPAGVGYSIQQLALSYLERELGVPIQRNVRLTAGAVTADFDGLAERRRQGRPDIAIEIKIAGTMSYERQALDAAEALVERTRSILEATGLPVRPMLVVVVQNKKSIADQTVQVEGKALSISPTLKFEVVDFDDIGFSSGTLEEDISQFPGN